MRNIICKETCERCIHSEEPSGKIKSATIKCKFKMCDLDYEPIEAVDLFICKRFEEKDVVE